MAVKSRARPQIIRARVPSDAGGAEKEFSPEACYILRDSEPFVEFEVIGQPLIPLRGRGAGILSRVADDELESGESFWQRWSLGKHLSRERRMGRFELPLENPRGTTLRCYVVPEKLLDVADVWRMIEDIQDETLRPVAWEPRGRSSVRSWVRDGDATPVSMASRLLTRVEQELRMARLLRRNPRRELAVDGAMRFSPEMAIVSHWASRRSADVDLALISVRDDCEYFARLLGEHIPKNRRPDLVRLRAHADGLREKLVRVRARVRSLVALEELAAPLIFGPMTQRDHRMRRLLRAFAPPRSRVLSRDREREWSLFPPTSLNKIFEIWGAVWMVRVLRTLGFEGRMARAAGSDNIERARWELCRDALTVTVDYEPHPALVDFKGVPSPRVRTESASVWAIRRQAVDVARPFFGTEEKCSPDYLIRIEGPAGRALAVGDACVADPRHHTTATKDFKPEVIVGYRRSIHWAGSGFVQSCDMMGGFVIFPGPPARWSGIEAASHARDVWLLCPRPADAPGSAEEEFSAFLIALFKRVERAAGTR